MSVFAIPVKRPVATAMFFVGLILLGVIATQKLPVELMPEVEGNWLYVNFLRPGSEAEVVEREILLPLSARVSELPDVLETSAEVRGPGGSFQVRFDADTDLKVRELELRRIAAELARTLPPGSVVDVQAIPFGLISRYAMTIAVVGPHDLDVLYNLAEERIQPRIAAVAGVASVIAVGGARREVTIHVDPDRAAQVGVNVDEVGRALQRAVGRPTYLGGVEDEAGRTAVLLDGRVRGLQSLGETRIRAGGPVQVRHVARVEIGPGRSQSVSRIDGRRAISMFVFKDEGANLVALGEALRERVAELNVEYAPHEIQLLVSSDAAEIVQQQLDRLKTLGLSGFVIALLVLFLFLRQLRGVSVVGIAVPVSLLAALALLYVSGQSLNLITIFGLAVGIGMLVDNSIVVFEAVQRRLERGADADRAAEQGVRVTVRAILAASVTTIVVFLPINFVEFEQAVLRSVLQILTLAIVLPLVGSVIVAVGLVPLLAGRLAAPAALARIARMRERREALAGLPRPNRGRELFTGMLTVALRRPGAWLTGVGAAVLFTVAFALPWVAFQGLAQQAPEANPVQFAVEIPSDATLDKAAALLDRLEEGLRRLDGVDRVESSLREANRLINGTISVFLADKAERPEGVNAARIRGILRQAAEQINRENPGLQLRDPGDPGGSTGGGGDDVAALLGGGPAEYVVSGPDSQLLERVAADVGFRLASISEIQWSYVSGRRAQDELRVIPDDRRLAAFGLTADVMLPALAVVRREGQQMQVGYTESNGKEIPLTVRRDESLGSASTQLRKLRVTTPAGVLPLAAVADVRRMPPPRTIQHKNGRREMSVFYRYGPDAPQTGPARDELERRIQTAIREVYRPPGYTVEKPAGDSGTAWFKRILVPVLLLLYAVLAVTFESATMPLLVLVALPLTVLGATWALVFTQTPAGPMALVGTVALIGLTVNPAILLVDRMQQRIRSGASTASTAGAAALAAVRERARPVLMTTATTVAGLWPLALVTGAENEVWPPFATVVMGGLITSTVLTLLVIPVGFVMLQRLDRLFGRMGPWIMIGWVGATAAIMTPLFTTDVIASTTWRIVTTVLVAGLLLGAVVLVLRRPERPEPVSDDGPPPLVVRFLKKVYGRPGPVARAWRLPELFARRVLARGGKPFDVADARVRLAPLLVLTLAAAYLTVTVQSSFWKLVFLLVAAAFGVALAHEARRARGFADPMGRADLRGPEGMLALMIPWIAMSYLVLDGYLLSRITMSVARNTLGETGPTFSAADRPDFPAWVVVVVPVLVLVVQLGRRTALRLARGEIPSSLAEGRLRRARTLWRRWSRRVFGLDLPREEVKALTHFHMRAERGMIGILGPNGAGKTTLLRQLAGIIEPTVGTITLGGVPLHKLRRYLARYVGYLPQDFGLPTNLTAREYLDYFALLYEMRPAAHRRERVGRLLEEVGLGDRADDKIGDYSGGMRQRVAVARTLLRLPPIIIVDEPTVGLDPRERIRFRNLLARLADGRVVLFSTHVVEDVAVACERVVVLSEGRMVFDGPPEGLARYAEGRVWTARMSTEQLEDLPAGAKVVDQVPEAEGVVRVRVLCATRFHPSAEPDRPSLEDGYLMLTGEGFAEAQGGGS